MFKTLLKQIGDYRKDAILTPVFVILEVVMEVIIPLMMAAIIDYGLSEQSLKMVCLIGAAMIVMAGLALFFGVESGKTDFFFLQHRQVFHGRACDQNDDRRDECTAGISDVNLHLCEGADYAGQRYGDDVSDSSPLRIDFSGGDHCSGSRACPDLIKGKPDFKKGVS